MLDLSMVKQRQQQMWATGDYSMVASYLVIMSELQCESLGLCAGQRVLDVATGSGNTAIAAARRKCRVVGIDFVPALLERARERAAAERLEIDFQIGDAENIPFPDASFDVVMSTIGAMFAPDQARVAAELLRVCRPGGWISLANWTPEGFVGEWFSLERRYNPAPPDLPLPVLWGTEARVGELFGDQIEALTIRERTVRFHFRSVEHWLEFYRTYFGPTRLTFQTLDADRQQRLAQELTELVLRYHHGCNGALTPESPYIEVIAHKRA